MRDCLNRDRRQRLFESPASTARKTRIRLRWLTFLPIAFLFWMLSSSQPAVSQALPEFELPENPLAGRWIFEQKGCVNCHSVNGQGGAFGPDLGDKKVFRSFLDLAAQMWNHAPEMLRRMRELDLPYPTFSRQEIDELIAYLYYLRFLGEPGDLYRGRILVEEKRCLTCHSVSGKGGHRAVAFDTLAQYASPLYMAQALWNHGPEMNRELADRGLEPPVFGPGEIGDLSAYIRGATQAGGKATVYMSPGSPERGYQVIQSKGCLQCHALAGSRGKLAPDFATMDWNRSVTEIAGLMWNHSLAMVEMMGEMNLQWPRFEDHEMSDLIAYLYFLGFRDPPGDESRGSSLFETKGCANCHGSGPSVDLSFGEMRTPGSSSDLARIMWNHAPVMETRATERSTQWPRLNRSEMADLLEFLKKVTQ